MATFRDIDEARAYFEGDRFAVENGMTLDELGEDWSVCSMAVTPGCRNANGGVNSTAVGHANVVVPNLASALFAACGPPGTMVTSSPCSA